LSSIIGHVDLKGVYYKNLNLLDLVTLASDNKDDSTLTGRYIVNTIMYFFGSNTPFTTRVYICKDNLNHIEDNVVAKDNTYKTVKLGANYSDTGTSINFGGGNAPNHTVFDGQNYTVTGNGAGFWLYYVTGTGYNTIKNFNIVNFQYGAETRLSSNNIFDNFNVYNSSYGVYFSTGSNNTVQNSIINNISNVGLRMFKTKNSLFTNNTLSSISNIAAFLVFVDDMDGTYLNQNNIISYNNISQNNGNGTLIWLNGTNIIFNNNTVWNITGNGKDAIQAQARGGSVEIKNNTFHDVYTAINYINGTNSLIYNNLFYNVQDAFELDGGASNISFYNNTIRDSVNGIYYEIAHMEHGTSNNISMRNNIIYNISNSGFYINHSVDDLFDSNNVTNATYNYFIVGIQNSTFIDTYNQDITIVNTTQPIIFNNSGNIYTINAQVSSTITIYNSGNLLNISLLNGRITLGRLFNLSYIPSNYPYNFTIITWNTTGDYYKKWNESSTNASTTTQHIIGDFPANINVQIKRDGINYAQLTSNATGYINWTYLGGYSEHQFEAELAASTPTSQIPLSTSFPIWIVMFPFLIAMILYVIMTGIGKMSIIEYCVAAWIIGVTVVFLIDNI